MSRDTCHLTDIFSFGNIQVDKIGIKLEHIVQLASYMNKISTAFEDSVVGILFDKHCFRIAISPWKDAGGRALPSVYVSPAVCWRESGEVGAALNGSAVLLLSMVHLIRCERRCFGEDIPQVVAEKLYNNPYSPTPASFVSGSLVDILRGLVERDKEIETKLADVQQHLEKKDRQLEEKDRQLEEINRQLEEKDHQLEEKYQHLEEKVEELHKQLISLQNVVSPKKCKRLGTKRLASPGAVMRVGDSRHY